MPELPCDVAAERRIIGAIATVPELRTSANLELDDLWAIVEELNDKFGFGYMPNRERMKAKKEKVQKYLGFSIYCGMVDGEPDVLAHPMILPNTP